MPFSVFELFKIGVGPSSSHTMGPMTAAADFVGRALPLQPARVMAELFGSLALTGKGHATDSAVILGLCGERPEALDPDAAAALVTRVRAEGVLPSGVAFDEARDVLWHQRRRLSHHSNGMIFTAFAADGSELLRETAYSIGGGAVVGEAAIARNAAPALRDLPYAYASGAELLARAAAAGIGIADLALANELAGMPEAEVRGRLAAIRAAMSDCIDRGCRTGGDLPGGLRVVRRAPWSPP